MMFPLSNYVCLCGSHSWSERLTTVSQIAHICEPNRQLKWTKPLTAVSRYNKPT
ncbi:MAG: hypothetical protein IKK07_06280 [Bacteroides sp.]|nr:hypothetical protein [Bacteroides sp.]